MTSFAPVRSDSRRRATPLPLDPTLREAVLELEQGAGALLRDEGRMAVWRFLGAALAARQAIANHATACASPTGPLTHIAESRPALRYRVQRSFAEHNRILALLDGLIAGARSADSPADATALRRRALLCASMASAHGRRVRATVFEWACRDIGGEAG